MSDTTTGSNTGLRRDLKARHITMIAVGGSIGTGLFVASGARSPGRSRQRPVRLLDHRPHGLLPDDEPRRTRRLYEPVAGSFSTYPPLRRRRLRLRPRLELLLQLGHYGRSRPCGRPARHGLVVPRRARNTLERTLPRVHIHAQLHIRKRLRRERNTGSRSSRS